MTCREKLKIEHPDMINEACYGGCMGCPGDYGYIDGLTVDTCGNCGPDACDKCWDREIPVVLPAEDELTIAYGNMQQDAIVIECGAIILKQKGIGIKIEIDSAYFDDINTISINGHKFKKEN